MLSKYDETILNEVDRRRIKRLKNKYNRHMLRQLELHEEAEKIRESYGYSGGMHGDEFIKLS